jgi:hypothetical protein
LNAEIFGYLKSSDANPCWNQAGVFENITFGGGGWERWQPMLLWDCRIYQNTSPSDRATCQFLIILNRSTWQWNLWVIEIWSPIGGRIQHYIGRSPWPTVLFVLLLPCFTDWIQLVWNELENSASASWSSWVLHRAPSAPVGILSERLSKFHW